MLLKSVRKDAFLNSKGEHCPLAGFIHESGIPPPDGDVILVRVPAGSVLAVPRARVAGVGVARQEGEVATMWRWDTLPVGVLPVDPSVLEFYKIIRAAEKRGKKVAGKFWCSCTQVCI